MFGSLVQKLQSLSPLTSPTTSPTNSPKTKRKFGFGKPRRRKDSSWWKEEAREVQSEPELDYEGPLKKDKRKTSAPVTYAQHNNCPGVIPVRTNQLFPAHQLGAGAPFTCNQGRKDNLVVRKSDLCGNLGFISRRDEPHPTHSHLDTIYDVPARIKRRAGIQEAAFKVAASRTVGRVEGMREAERLSEYEQYFASLLVDTHPDHPDYSDLHQTQERLGQLVSRHEDDSGELERIQDLFPNDNLRLYEREPVSQKMKGLIRKRSTTAARLQRAFSAKGVRSPEPQSLHNNNNGDFGSPNGMIPNSNKKDGKPKRQFIMETPVHFTTGVQSQERHLFLFTDLLLVAKARSGGNFKLKEKVRVSEMWLAACMDDVVEVSKTAETSFVVGWPTTNVVATFSCVATKDLWYNKLSQVIQEERDKEVTSTAIQVTYVDPHTNVDTMKTVQMSPTATARECVSLLLEHLEMNSADESKFQLWVKSQNEEAPYPLIGHELPFAIKMNCLRDLLQECDTDQCNNIYNTDILGRCQFILRQERKASDFSNNSPEGLKKTKKSKKSPLKLNKVFKRSNSKGDITADVPDGVTSPREGLLFGQSLDAICGGDGDIPPPIRALLLQLLSKGPFTVGIFRKSANVRLVREVKEKLDLGDQTIDFDLVPILACAALLKEFFRALPDCLLCSHLYEGWLQMSGLSTYKEKVSRSKILCSQLNKPRLVLLQHFLCVLYHIQKREKKNMMSASNLAVCVGPSILWPSSPMQALSSEASKQAPAAVEFLIERCTSIFGKDIIHLLGDPPEHDPLRQDSGAEESDSLHSSGGMRRDDSSIDSLEREFIGDGELSPLPRKDKMSLTNLSRDSGLTMSDSQLYTPDEEESESTSSGHSGGYKYNNDGSVRPQQSHDRYERSHDKFQHYSAPNNPNAIYTAVFRRPDKTPTRCDEPDGYYAAPSRDHTKVHITYSSPSYAYGSHTPNKEYPIYNTNSYTHGYFDDVIYSVPSGISENRNSPYGSNTNFQRHDWTRRCSNVKKVSRTNSGEGLVRSTSEESLLNKYNTVEYGVSLCASGNVPNDEVFNRGRALPPSPIDHDNTNGDDRSSPLRRSRSAHQVAEELEFMGDSLSQTPENYHIRRDSLKFHRSRSTPQIHDEGDRSYDSSTLSDDDSTPHVSRSNSRGKECNLASNVLQAWDSGGSNSRNSSFKSERTGSVCTVVSAGSTSTLSSNPPSYEEALNRRSLMQNSPGGLGMNEFAIREEKIKSARAKQLYEESLRIYQEENTYPGDLVRASPARAHDVDDAERPPPLPPKSEPPPLPPKQKTKKERRSQDLKGETGKKSEKSSDSEKVDRLDRRHDVHSEGNGHKRLSEGNNRLKHLPPVHVETPLRKDRPVNQIKLDTPLHKTIIYTTDHTISPPSLPPKERTIIEVIETPFEEKKCTGSYSKASENVTSKVEKKSIETQTDDCDLIDSEDERDSKSQGGNWDHVTSVSVPDTTFKRRSRVVRKDSNSSLRSRSMPGRETYREYDSSESDTDDYYNPRDFSNNSIGLKDLKQLDPDLQQEISWSVSQLRAIFGDTLKGAKVHPPPYRPPPNHTAHRAPITSYHLGAGDAFISRKQRKQSNYGEESYV